MRNLMSEVKLWPCIRYTRNFIWKTFIFLSEVGGLPFFVIFSALYSFYTRVA